MDLKAKTRSFSIYLLKPDFRTPRKALKDVAELERHAFTAGGRGDALYVRQGQRSRPDWVAFLAEATDPQVDYETQSLSAVLLLTASGRRFAVTFGHGRSLLDPNAYERDFGLRCALNGVNPELLRRTEARTLGEFALHTLREISRLSGIEGFEIDTDRELVVGLAGLLKDPALGSKIGGRDAVQVTAAVHPPDLRGLCTSLLGLSEAKAYTEHFSFYDKIGRVRDPQKVAKLETQALEALGQQRYGEFDLFPPELVPEGIAAFRYSPRPGESRVEYEPSARMLREVLGHPRPAEEVTDLLKSIRLKGIDPEGEVVAEWPLLRCLHWEHSEDGTRYVLDGGQWYRIAQSLVTEVESFVNELTASGIPWPATTDETHEGKYNKDAAKELGFACLDRQNVTLPGQSPIEPCDLLSSERQFVHVKRRKGGSSPISHLFAQAIVASQCFVLDSTFRERMHAKLEVVAPPGFEGHLLGDVDPAEWDVVLALMAPPSRDGVAAGLPFFSKVMLRQTVRVLRSMGFNVFVDLIPARAGAVRGRRARAGRGNGRAVSAAEPSRGGSSASGPAKPVRA